MGNRYMRRHGALVDAFPNSQQKESKAWDIIVDGCKTNKLLTQRLRQLESDLDIKNMLINYVSGHLLEVMILTSFFRQTWQGMGSMRAEVILKARQGVPTWYGLSELESGEEVTNACKWLLKDNTFLHGDMDLKVSDA
jgi:hypothetical protein